jgi:hypothetical protein
MKYMKYSYGKKELYDRDKNTRVFIFSILVCIIIMMIIPSLSSTVYGSDGQPSSDFSNGKNVSDNDDRFVALTLDDGFESQYTNAITILDKYGFKASFSIICEYVGEQGYMTWDEIKALEKERNCYFQVLVF